MDKRLDRKRLGVLTAAGLAVATLCAGVAFVFSGNNSEQQPKRDTVPVGQLVDVPVSSSPSSSVEPPATTVADPSPKDTTVPNQPAQQPAPQTVQQPALADEPTNTPPPPVTTMPTGENGAPLNPPPAPPAPSVGNPPGMEPIPNPDPAPRSTT